MNIVGYTSAEVFQMCQDAGIPITRSGVNKAFDTAGNPSPRSLDVSYINPKLRVATPESVETWLAFRKEKHGIRQGQLHPDDCQYLKPRTAWKNFMKDVLKNMPPETHEAVKAAALKALKPIKEEREK